MANKQALRELQNRLAERLQAARSQPGGQSWLGIEAGGRGFLLPLRQAGEIFPLAPILPVPYVQRWFRGVANLRGQLHGVVDLARFLGVDADEGGRDQARLVGFNPTLESHCVLLVDRLAGLRGEADLEVEAPSEPSPARPAFVGSRRRDAAGRWWQELSLAELAADDTFLRIDG